MVTHLQSVRLFFLLSIVFLFGQFLFLARYQREPYPAILLPGGAPPSTQTDTLRYTRHEFKIFNQNNDSLVIPCFEVFSDLPRQYTTPTAYFLERTPSLMTKPMEVIKREVKIGSLSLFLNLTFKKDSLSYHKFTHWLTNNLLQNHNINPSRIMLYKVKYYYIIATRQSVREELANPLVIEIDSL